MIVSIDIHIMVKLRLGFFILKDINNMKEKRLKTIIDTPFIQNGILYCDDHAVFVEGWNIRGFEDERDIEEFEAYTHYWQCVVKCCKPLTKRQLELLQELIEVSND